MSEERDPSGGGDEIKSDLVEYVIVGMPNQDALASVVPALAELVQTAKIRILDLVVVVRHDDGAVEVRELETVESMEALRHVEGELGGMLTEDDIALTSLALRPGTAGIVLVAEDRWAEPLSTAVRRAGGGIVAGERIPAARVEAVLADRAEDEPGGG